MKHLYIRIDDDLHARVKETAGARGISMNQFVIESLRVVFNTVQILASVEIGEKHEILLMIPKDEYDKIEGTSVSRMKDMRILNESD